MDFLNEIVKNLTREDSIVQKLNLNLDQVILDKQNIENLVDVKRKQLIKLEKLLELLSKSEDILIEIKKKFTCQKCSSEFKNNDKNIKEKTQMDQSAKGKLGNQTKSTNKSETTTFDRLQKILNNCTKTKQENGTKKYQYSTENKGIQIHRSKPHPELDSFDLKKFKLVQMHMNEPSVDDFNSIKEWTIIKKAKKNLLLESRMAKRNNEMMNQVKKNIDSEILINFTKRNLIKDVYMLMNYDFCNNKYGFNKNKSKKPRKKIKDVMPLSDKNDDLLMELYGFETENKENETKIISDDLYDDLNDNSVIDLIEFDFDKFNETIKKDSKIEDTKKVLSPKKQFKNLEISKKDDVYSRRKATDRRLSQPVKRRSRSNSRPRKRSRSRSKSRSNSKRRELDTSYRDRKYQYKNDQRYKNYHK